MGRVRQNAGRPKKWGDVICKVMFMPAHLENKINEFVSGLLAEEIKAYRHKIRTEIKDPEAIRKEAERMAMLKERKRLKRLKALEDKMLEEARNKKEYEKNGKI